MDNGCDRLQHQLRRVYRQICSYDNKDVLTTSIQTILGMVSKGAPKRYYHQLSQTLKIGWIRKIKISWLLEAELLYKPLCPSVGRLVGLSVCRSECNCLFWAHFTLITLKIYVRSASTVGPDLHLLFYEVFFSKLIRKCLIFEIEILIMQVVLGLISQSLIQGYRTVLLRFQIHGLTPNHSFPMCYLSSKP